MLFFFFILCAFAENTYMEEKVPPSPPNSMLRHPKWQQVGVTKSIYANIEFRGRRGDFFFKHSLQCTPGLHVMEVLGRLPIP